MARRGTTFDRLQQATMSIRPLRKNRTPRRVGASRRLADSRLEAMASCLGPTMQGGTPQPAAESSIEGQCWRNGGNNATPRLVVLLLLPMQTAKMLR